MDEQIKAIDCLITPNPARSTPRWGADYLFKGAAERLTKGTTIEQTIQEMEEAGVEKGIIDMYHGSLTSDEERESTRAAVLKHPERFIPAMGVNPRNGMEELRKVERAVRDEGVQVIRMGPWRIQLPPNDKIYYPFYAKAIELGVAVQVNIGFPGPQVPAWVQDPIHLDEVCWFFPELKLLMTHVGEPWVDTVIKMLLRWPNAYLIANSVAPKYYPAQLIQYMNTRGEDKVLFGTEYPFLSFKRCIDEIKGLDLRDHVRRKFLRENALKLFKWKE